jgi:polyphosphate kinase
LEFNQRVLDEALDTKNPLLERLKFFCIVSSNLDEFFEVRVAGIKQQIESDVVERSMDGLTATESFNAVSKRIRQMVGDQYACWRQSLCPALVKNGVRILDVAQLDLPDMAWVSQYFRTQVRPVLTRFKTTVGISATEVLRRRLAIRRIMSTTGVTEREPSR